MRRYEQGVRCWARLPPEQFPRLQFIAHELGHRYSLQYEDNRYGIEVDGKMLWRHDVTAIDWENALRLEGSPKRPYMGGTGGRRSHSLPICPQLQCDVHKAGGQNENTNESGFCGVALLGRFVFAWRMPKTLCGRRCWIFSPGWGAWGFEHVLWWTRGQARGGALVLGALLQGCGLSWRVSLFLRGGRLFGGGCCWGVREQRWAVSFSRILEGDQLAYDERWRARH